MFYICLYCILPGQKSSPPKAVHRQRRFTDEDGEQQGGAWLNLTLSTFESVHLWLGIQKLNFGAILVHFSTGMDTKLGYAHI